MLQPVGIRCLLATLTAVSVTCAPAWPATAGEWPQILGPDRTGIAADDERLAPFWPATGPEAIWTRSVGRGNAGVAIAEGRGFLFHREGDQEITEAFDPQSGKTLWRVGYPTRFRPQVGSDDGPLCVPTISGDRLITLGAQGMLTCYAAATGQVYWQHQTHQEFDANEGYFGAGSSPLVISGCVVVNVGGRNDAGVVGFDLDTGEIHWQATDEPASYSAPTVIKQAGRQLAVVITRYQCLLIDPKNGSIGWQFPFGMRGPTVNAATPITWIDDDDRHRLLVTAAYGIGSVCGHFDEHSMTPLWQGIESLASQYGTPILLDGYLYCIDGRDDLPPATMKCVEAATGRVCWQEDNFGYGTLLAANGRLLATKTSGKLMLLEVSPTGLKICGSTRPLPGTIRALPALADGRLFLRDETTLTCLAVGR